MIVLDTNVVSELMNSKGSSIVRQWVAAQPINNFFTTTITQAEILYGIALLPSGKRQTELAQASELMFAEDFAGRILPFDETAAIAFARIASKRRRMGKPISQADAQILKAVILQLLILGNLTKLTENRNLSSLVKHNQH